MSAPAKELVSASALTLRLEILREAIDAYKANQKTLHSTDAERMMYALKIMECEAMIRELMA
jgi:threonyl-tRNA synthetase